MGLVSSTLAPHPRDNRTYRTYTSYSQIPACPPDITRIPMPYAPRFAARLRSRIGVPSSTSAGFFPCPRPFLQVLPSRLAVKRRHSSFSSPSEERSDPRRNIPPFFHCLPFSSFKNETSFYFMDIPFPSFLITKSSTTAQI